MDNNQTPQTPECVNEDRRAFLGTLAATVAICTTGLATKLLADELSDDTELASLKTGASDDAQGSGIDDAQETLTIEDIETQIANIQQQIEALEADADNLTEEQWIELDELYQRLAELENQQSQLIEQQIAEENQKQEINAEAMQNLEEISSYITPDIRSQFSELWKILSKGDALLANFENLDSDERDEIILITYEAVAYLKNNKHELASVVRSIQRNNPEQYQAFKTFLISQDEEFRYILPEIEWNIHDGFEATISAALPTAPDSGNLSSGFVSELDDGTQVKVESGDDGIVRSLDLAGTNYPIETEVQDVNLAAAERERETVLNEIGPRKQIAEYAHQLIADNPDKDFAEIKDELQSTLGAEQFAELGIDSFADRESAMQELDSKIQEYNDQIEAAQNAFRKIAQEAIRKTRESYERKDKLVKQSLRLVYDTGFSMIPRSVTDRVIATVNERPADYGFQTEIHLDEGQIWFNSHTDSGAQIQTADKTRFAEMMNVMLWAELVDATAVRWWYTGVKDRAAFGAALNTDEIGMQNSGAAATILQRLRDGKSKK